jgi:pyrroloquinoline-quinone synthase
VHANCDDQPTRRQLLDNLIDEEAGSPNHPELWIQFAECLGVSKDDAQSTEKWDETKNLIETFRSVCATGKTAQGLAALYAYESQIPAVSESKIKGLIENYDVTAARDYEYFSVHVEADREHSAAERQMLSEYVGDENAASVSAAVTRILDALWEMLSGVCRRHAIAC